MAKKTRAEGVVRPPRRRITPALHYGSLVKCADNTGATVLKIIGVLGYKGRLNRIPFCSVGDLVKVVVKEGRPEIRKQQHYAVIIRQRQPYRRPDGIRVAFESNAAVLVTADGKPKGTEIRGPVAKEVVERWKHIGSIAKMVV